MSAYAQHPFAIASAGITKSRLSLPEIRPPFSAPPLPAAHPRLELGQGPPAARFGDDIAHSLAMISMLKRMAVAALIGIAAVALTVFTFGMGAVAVMAIGAAVAGTAA